MMSDHNLLMTAAGLVSRAAFDSTPLTLLQSAAQRGLAQWMNAPEPHAYVLGQVATTLQLAVALREADEAAMALLDSIGDPDVMTVVCTDLLAARHSTLDDGSLDRFVFIIDTWRTALTPDSV